MSHEIDELTADSKVGVDLTSDPPIASDLTQQLFRDRFAQMVHTTDRYDSALDEAIDSIERRETSPAAEVTANKYEQTHIRDLRSRLMNCGARKVIIEAAHVYMYEDLADDTLKQSLAEQSRAAGALALELENNGIEVVPMLFIDDYNPNPDSRDEISSAMDVDKLFEHLTENGFSPALVAREAAMAPLAANLLAYMDDVQGLVAEKQTLDADGRVVSSTLNLNYRGTELYRADDQMYTCALLDSALTLAKFALGADGTVNVLPRQNPNQTFSYRNQQRKMRWIIGDHLGVRVTPMMNLFTTPNGPEHATLAAGAHHALRKRRR